MIFFLVINFALVFFYYQRVKKEPLHPDSAEFIYAGLIQRLGYVKDYFKKDKAIAPLSFDRFPPEPIIGNEKNPYSGAFPKFRDKQAVWWFFEQLYKRTSLSAKEFRQVNAGLIGLLSWLFFMIINQHLSLYHTILWSLIFQLTVMLPHFDFLQIHAEEWGITILLIVSGCLIFSIGQIWWPILYGTGLISLFFFVKITFLPSIIYFYLAPLIIFGKDYFFYLSLLSGLVTALLVLVLLAISGRLFPFLWTITPKHLISYKKGASTSRSKRQRQRPFSVKHFLGHYKIEIFIFLLFTAVEIPKLVQYSTLLPIERLMLGWLVLALIEIIIQGKMYPAHLQPLIIPGLMLLAFNEHIVAPVIAVIIVLMWSKYYLYNQQSIVKQYGEKSQNPFLNRLLHYDAVATFVKQVSCNKILCIGYCSPIYVLAERRGSLGIFEAGVTTEPIDLDKKYGKKWRWWLLNAMVEKPPEVIVDCSGMIHAKEIENATGFSLKKIKQIGSFAIYKIDKNQNYTHPQTRGLSIFTIDHRE